MVATTDISAGKSDPVTLHQKPYEVYNGGKKMTKSKKLRKPKKSGKLGKSKKTNKHSKKHRKSRKNQKSRKYRKNSRSKKIKVSGKSRKSRKYRKRLRGGSGASAAWAQSFMSGETTFCPDGKVEVPHIPTNGVEKAGPIGINDVNKSFTKIAAQASANRQFDNNVGK